MEGVGGEGAASGWETEARATSTSATWTPPVNLPSLNHQTGSLQLSDGVGVGAEAEAAVECAPGYPAQALPPRSAAPAASGSIRRTGVGIGLSPLLDMTNEILVNETAS